MPSVVHIVHSLEIGGLEQVVLNLVRTSVRAGERAAIVCLDRRGTLWESAKALGVEVRCLEKPPGVKLSYVTKLRDVFAELRPDVVHSHQIGALFYAGPAARRARVPVIVHTEHGHHWYGRKAKWIAWWAARYAQRFFCVSQEIADAIIAARVAPAPKVAHIPNGIDVNAFGVETDRAQLRRSLDIPVDAAVVGTVGRLNEIKCQDVLIRAFARLLKDEPRAHLLLVGDGPMRTPLESLMRELNLGQCVHFAGHQSEPAPYLHAMDVFAITSRSEGMPLAVLEAWASGLPVVASRVGGLPALIDDGRTGVLFDSGNEEQLAHHVRDLLAHPDERAAMGRVCREHVRTHFDVSVMAQNYQRHYIELLARQRSANAVQETTIAAAS